MHHTCGSTINGGARSLQHSTAHTVHEQTLTLKQENRVMGVEKEILNAGTGPKPVPGQKVTVHCTGFGKNGDLSQKFWR